MNTSILNRNGQIDINQCIEENAKAVKVVGKLKLDKKKWGHRRFGARQNTSPTVGGSKKSKK